MLGNEACMLILKQKQEARSVFNDLPGAYILPSNSSTCAFNVALKSSLRIVWFKYHL